MYLDAFQQFVFRGAEITAPVGLVGIGRHWHAGRLACGPRAQGESHTVWLRGTPAASSAFMVPTRLSVRFPSDGYSLGLPLPVTAQGTGS